MEEPLPEPWMRGPLPGVDPLLSPVLYCFTQAREDLARYTGQLSTEQLWVRPHGFGAIGFHIRHIGGSVERLTAYLFGERLTPEQLGRLGQEMTPGASAQELLAELDGALSAASERIRGIDPAILSEPRYVGRKRLPTTVIGLLTHIAEHTQRHVGQAITAAKWVQVG